MDIRTEQLEALLKQQEFQAKKTSAAKSQSVGGFETALQQEAALEDTDGNATIAPPPGAQASLVGQVLLVDAEKISTAEAMTDEKAYEFASGAMDELESYVSALRNPREGNLREAYAAIENVEAQVQTLKQQSEPLLEQNTNLASLVNELEVLATTEKFKFNRGDYST